MPETGAPGPEPPLTAEDALADLRGHVRSAQQAAERLAREAETLRPRARRDHERQRSEGERPPMGGGEEAPPSGWASSTPPPDTSRELRALVDLVESLRSMLPAELREQLNELVRQVLLLLRAVIDWLVARVEREAPGRDVEIQDIPIS